MSPVPEPMIKLQPDGVPSSVNYNIPEPVNYDGVNVLELDVDQSRFLPAPVKPLTKVQRQSVSPTMVLDAMTSGFANPQLFPDLGVPEGFLVYAETVPDAQGAPMSYRGCFLARYGPAESEASWVTERLRQLTPSLVWDNILRGKNLKIVRLPSHRYDYRFAEAETPDGAEPTKRLAIIEYYRLSTFLGRYGAGRTINTFSLLPGEKTRITIKTYKKTTQSMKESSTILDSLNDDSSTDFETLLQDERSDKSTRARMDSWHVEAEASGNFAVGKVKMSAGYKGSSNSAREQFAHGVTNALQKHVAKASNRRDIKVEQTTETTTETGEEAATERELKNINVSRTLNFVFRQMNQEFVTLLHLTDVRIGYTDGMVTRVAPLHALDDFLRQFIVEEMAPLGGGPLPEAEQYRTKLRDGILAEVAEVLDHEDRAQRLTEKVELKSAAGRALGSYWRVRKGLRSEFVMPTTGYRVGVDGVILKAMYNVIRTDGLVTEALLGRSNGLDPYSQGLQDNTVADLALKNDLLEQQIGVERFAQEIVAKKSTKGASLLKTLFPPAPVEAAAGGDKK